jgi:hypothetical protein
MEIGLRFAFGFKLLGPEVMQSKLLFSVWNDEVANLSDFTSGSEIDGFSCSIVMQIYL